VPAKKNRNALGENIWFRIHDRMKDDPKVLLLPSDALRWQWLVLLCVANQNEGKIPSVDIAALGLRLPPHKAAQVIAILHRAGLLDKTPGGYYEPHNWEKWQYRKDKTGAERQARWRERHRHDQNNDRSNDQSNVQNNAPITPLRNGPRNAVTVTTPEAEAEAEADTDIDDDADAQARPKPSVLISEQAKKLADEIAVIAGHDLAFVPPSWCGAAYRVQQWIDRGWQRELVVSSIKEQIGRRRGRQVNSIQYFETGIADHIARQTAPLPNVVELPAKTVEVTRDSKSGIAAIQRLRKQLGVSAEDDLQKDGDLILRLPSRSAPES
jgi:hypothetical protein